MMTQNPVRNFVALFAILLLLGCSSGPSGTAEEFLTHIAKGEIADAKKLASESTGKLIDLANSFGGFPIDPDFSFQLVEEKVEGNKATIRYKSSKNGKTEVIHLVKIDGSWKVHEEKR